MITQGDCHQRFRTENFSCRCGWPAAGSGIMGGHPGRVRDIAGPHRTIGAWLVVP
jgi:hypothetical protein